MQTINGTRKPAALQVIVLGSGGGPIESNTTAFLIRSIDLQWSRGSVLALDAGVHVGAITRLFEETLEGKYSNPIDQERPVDRNGVKASNFTIGTKIIDGPFKGFECQAKTPGANAAYVMRELIDAYLITHPHLDHISGIITNSPSIGPNRTKILAGLPSTIEAIKTHILNGIIWPNLSNENNGVGFLKYTRLKDGGERTKGEKLESGYVNICQGLSILPRAASHGCIHDHGTESGTTHPKTHNHLLKMKENIFLWIHQLFAAKKSTVNCDVVESTAFFVKDNKTNTEILVFGDIEPDSLSLAPRNKIVWKDAAAKIKAGNLKAIFMECSFDNSQPRDELYGHMNPFFVMQELQVLADFVSSTTSTEPETPTTSITTNNHEPEKQNETYTTGSETRKKPLEGITVVIIHMKEKLEDGPGIRECVERDLSAIEKEKGLGCKFEISKSGMSLEF